MGDVLVFDEAAADENMNPRVDGTMKVFSSTRRNCESGTEDSEPEPDAS